MKRRAGLLLAAVLALLVGAAVFAPYLDAMRWAASSGRPIIVATPQRLAPGVRWIDDWFAVQPLAPGIFAIGEPRYGQCNFAYLFVGADRALLFDSGPGLRDIGRVARSLTDRPVTALPSHLHFDHVGGLRHFASVALPDVADLRARTSAGRLQLHRFEHLGFVEGIDAPAIRVTQWIGPGSVIDLGGRRLRLAAAPGHTPDAVILTDLASGDVYTGDVLYPGNVYAYLPGTDLGSYAQSTKAIAAGMRPGAKIHGGHGCAGTGPVAAPVQDIVALRALTAALSEAQRLSFRPEMPRVIKGDAGVTLRAKHPWMAR